MMLGLGFNRFRDDNIISTIKVSNRVIYIIDLVSNVSHRVPHNLDNDTYQMLQYLFSLNSGVMAQEIKQKCRMKRYYCVNIKCVSNVWACNL